MLRFFAKDTAALRRRKKLRETAVVASGADSLLLPESRHWSVRRAFRSNFSLRRADSVSVVSRKTRARQPRQRRPGRSRSGSLQPLALQRATGPGEARTARWKAHCRM